MIVALSPSRAGVVLFRLLLVSVFIVVLLFSRQYYLPLANDDSPLSPLLVSSGRSSSNLAYEDAEAENLQSPVDSATGIPIKSSESTCLNLPGAEDVLLVLKTGATEVFEKLPEQLVTLLQCVPNYMLFSDVEQDIGEYHLFSALDEVSGFYKDNHEDFEFLKKLQKYQTEHQDLSKLTSDQGWNLDKWKFIPMLHKAFSSHFDTKWFIFIEADTFLSWTNMLQLLSRLGSTEPLYFGALYGYGNTTFAQGGIGYVISNAAAKAFEDTYDPEHVEKWERETSEICCGDVEVGAAMLDSGVPITPAWPLMQPDPPPTLDWSDRIWCTPAITWHHVHPFEVEAIWRFEQNWVEQNGGYGKIPQTPYLYSDLFEYFVQPYIYENRTDWDNMSRDRTFTEPSDDHPKEGTNWDDLSDEEKQSMWDELSDVERQAVESAEACYAACDADEECLQWSFKPGSCHLNRVVRLGRAVDLKKENSTTSGWMPDRIEQFKQRQPPCVPAWDLNS